MSNVGFDPVEAIRNNLLACNHTELYQICRRRGIRVEPQLSREQLIDAYINDTIYGTTNNVFDSWRHGLTGFVFDHWRMLEPQLTCPIKSKDPKSCWGCLDLQVVACVEGNHKYERLIQLHRKDTT